MARGEAGQQAGFFVAAGQVYQRAIDYPDVELDFYDLTGSEDPAHEVGEISSSIRCTPMPLSGPLFKFALFKLCPMNFICSCCHHIAMDGLGMVLVSRRIAAIYSALVAGEPVPLAYFGSLSDLVGSEAGSYEASPDHVDDRDYWSAHLPRRAAHHRPAGSSAETTAPPVGADRTGPVRRGPGQRNSRRRCVSVGTRCCFGVRACWCAGYSAMADEVALDFPVSQTGHPESKTLPGMLTGVVSLLVKTSPAPGMTVAEFCRDVDTRIGNCSTISVFRCAPWRAAPPAGRDWEDNRVAINLRLRLTLDFGGAEATAS